MIIKKENIMNLVEMLTKTMTSKSSVEALSKKAGTSEKQTSSLISSALPMLISYMTQNALSSDGAASLANALTQHTDTSSMVQQFANADSADGNAIISHILGNDSASVVSDLAQQSGCDESQVTSLLGNMAPGLLSGLSAATTSAQSSQQSSGFDFSSLMSAFGGGQEEEEQTSSGGGFLSSLFGGGSSGSSNDGSGLISSLLGFLK